MNNLLNILGQKVRRITFCLFKDGEYYVIFSVLEEMLPEMQDYSDLVNDITVKERAKHSIAGSRDKVFYTIDYPIITREFLVNPIENYNVFGTSFKFFSKDFIKTPKSLEHYWLPNEQSDDDLFKCLPSRICAKYINCWIDKGHHAQKMMMSNHHFVKQLSQLSSDFYGIDLTNYSEFLGNIYFVRYNAYFKTIDWSVSENPNGMFLSFQTWKPTNDALYIDIVNKNKSGLFEYKVVREINTRQLNHFLELPDFPCRLDVRVTDTNGDLVYVYDDLIFLHAVSLDMNIVSKRVKIGKKDGSCETIDKYSSENSTIGSPILDSLVVNSSKMDYEALENNLDMVMFDGQPENVSANKARAKSVIRRIVSSARERCIIADPYFNLNDMVEYVFSMPQTDVGVKVLSAEEYLADKYESAKNKDAHINEATDIDSAIKSYKASVGGEKIMFHLLKGKCPLHDRYIVADDTVWLIGTSLNEIGNRMSTIIKLPKQSRAKVISLLDSLWYDKNKSISVEEYVAANIGNN